jgi:hypothetical protein
MTLQPIPSEFPYIGGKFLFFFISDAIQQGAGNFLALTGQGNTALNYPRLTL